MKANARQPSSLSFRLWSTRVLLALALLIPAGRAQNSPRPPGPPSPAERARQPGPWDQDIHVYRVPARGTPELLTTFARGGVATAARLGDGRLVVAHQYFPENNEAAFDKVAVHFSADEGRTWTAAQVIRLRGLPPGLRFPFDPTLVPLPDARVRMYFTSRRLGAGDAVPAIYSAISENAVDYTFEPGIRFGLERRGVIDCSVVLHRGEFHLFAPDNGVGHPADPGRDPRPPADRAQENTGYHAVSKDGLTFERVADVRLEGRRRWLGDAKSDGETITFYGTGEGGIWTAASADGEKWIPGPAINGVRAANPGTVVLRDGALLVAGTGPPRPGTASAQRRGPPPPPPAGPPRRQAGITFPGREWEIATPASQGVDAAQLQTAVALLEKTVGKDGAHELVVVRHGRMIWHGDDIDKVHGVWSFTKSFTSTALGLLIDDGKCTLDTMAKDFLPAMAAVYPEVTLRHFATMTSGYRAVGDEPQGTYAHGPSVTPFTPGPEPVFTPPGSHFAYWDSAMNQFANLLTRIAGESLEELLQRRIAEPIGMNREKWDWGDWKQVDGLVVNGGSGNKSGALKISAREAARFGLLFLNRGRWGERRLLSARWVDEATRVQVPAGVPHGFPTRASSGPGEYGFNWWVNGLKPDGARKFPDAPPRTYCAAGHNNNMCFVIPEWDMVIVRLGLDGSAGDKVWNDFLAQVGAAVAPGAHAGEGKGKGE